MHNVQGDTKLFTDISFIEVYYTWKPCTASKERISSIIVRDVRRFVLDGIMRIIYEDTKHHFVKIRSIFIKNNNLLS